MDETATPQTFFGTERALRIQHRAYELLAVDTADWTDATAPGFRAQLPTVDAPVFRAVIADEAHELLGSVAVVPTADKAAARALHAEIQRVGTASGYVAFLAPPAASGLVYADNPGNRRVALPWARYVLFVELLRADGSAPEPDERTKSAAHHMMMLPMANIPIVDWNAPTAGAEPAADIAETEDPQTEPDDELSDGDRQYVADGITSLVRGGFATEADIMEDLTHIVHDLVAGKHSGLVEEMTAFVRELIRSEKTAEAEWHDATANDALDRAFAALPAERIVALQNAGLTQSDGWSDAEEAARSLADDLEDEDDIDDEALGTAADSPWGLVRGAVFYHGQDLARAVRGAGLYLSFGAFSVPGRSRADHDEASREVGRITRDVLERHGVTVEWDGTADQRLFIPPFAWRRRRWTQAPTA